LVLISVDFDYFTFIYSLVVISILGFQVTSQALLKSVSAMLVSIVKFMLKIVHFYSGASLSSLYYFANPMNIQEEKNQ